MNPTNTTLALIRLCDLAQCLMARVGVARLEDHELSALARAMGLLTQPPHQGTAFQISTLARARRLSDDLLVYIDGAQ